MGKHFGRAVPGRVEAIDEHERRARFRQQFDRENPSERAARQERSARDRHRPRFHFQPPPSWMNDPIPFWGEGAYHVYFQYHPGRPYHDDMHWGHAVSRDLIWWEELPVALAPSAGGPDRAGVWTGCVVEAGGLYHALYTGVRPPQGDYWPQSQCLASSRDLVEWQKHPVNPVVGEGQKPPGFGNTFRDPHVWREPDGWYMALGGERKGHGAIFLYRSDDLVRWEYLHLLYEGEAACDECPDFFPLGGKYVLISSRGQTAWAVGEYRDHRFYPERHGVVDPGEYYAAKTLLDGSGRRILFGWVREGRPEEEQVAAGWSGALSLPRQLTLLPDGSLGCEPAPELTALRRRLMATQSGLRLGEGLHLLDGVAGDCVEVITRLVAVGASEFGLAVLCSPDLSEQTPLTWRDGRFAGTPLPLKAGEELLLRVFVDRSVVEAYANGRACRTVRAYPDAGSPGIGLIARGGEVLAESVEVWELGR